MQVHGAESRIQNPTDGPSSPFFERNSRQETCPRSRTHIPHGPSTRLLGCSERSRKRRKKSRREEKRVVAILRLEPAFFHAFTFSKRQAGKTIGPLAISNQPANSYYPQDVRPPPQRRRATPIKIRVPLPPNSQFSPTYPADVPATYMSRTCI